MTPFLSKNDPFWDILGPPGRVVPHEMTPKMTHFLTPYLSVFPVKSALNPSKNGPKMGQKVVQNGSKRGQKHPKNDEKTPLFFTFFSFSKKMKKPSHRLKTPQKTVQKRSKKGSKTGQKGVKNDPFLGVF